MKTYRKPPVATVLLLLVHLFTSQIGDAAAERDNTSISSVEKRPGKVITGSGDDTRAIADAVAKDSTQIEDEILSLLSKREIHRRRARQPSSKSDQDANQSSTVIVDVRNDEVDLERLKHAIAGYEPLRIVSRKTKRKIVDGLNATHDVRGISGESAGSENADLQRTYHEVLRNISQEMPTIIATNAGAATFNPYLSQGTTKSLKQTRVPEVTASTDDTEKSSSLDINSSHTSSTLKTKKPKKLLKKYLQPNRTATASRLSSIGGSKPDEEAGINGSTEKYYSVPSRKSKNIALPTQSNTYSNPTEKPGNLRQKWNLQEPSTTIPSFTSSNNSNPYNVLSIYNLNNLNVPNGANNLYLPRHKAMPRPFSISQLPNSPVTNNLEVSHPKPSSSPVNLDPKSISRSSGNVLPLVLPTDLFNPAATRRYVPLKRVNRVNPHGNSLIITEASPSTSPLGGITFEKPSADYGAPYANVIGTARSPPVAANGHQSSGRLDYYPILGNPAERTVAETAKTVTTYVPGQTSALYNPQGPKDSQVIRKNDFQPRIDTHGSSDVGKSGPNFNIGFALYNKFANLYSANAPKAVTQDYQNFQQPTSPSHTATISQQVPAFSYYVTLKPNSLPLPKIRPNVSVKPALAPYFDSKLLALQEVSGKESNSKERAETNEQSRVEDEDETENGTVDDRNNLGNYQTRINHEVYKVGKTPNRQREKDDSEEDQQQTRDYGQNRQRDENDERDEHESIHLENDEDEEESDETQGDEYVSIGERENEQNRNYYHQYDKHKYDQEDSEEEQQRDDRDDHDDDKEHENRKNHRNKSDRRTDVKQKIVNKEKYPDSRYDDDENYKQDKEYRNHYDRKKSTSNDRRKKNRQDHRREDPEDESIAEDKLVAQHSKHQDGPRKEYEKKRVDDSYTAHKYRHYETAPQKDSRHEEHRHEEYSETNPKHVRKEYHHHHHHQPAKDDHHDHRKHDDRNHDHDDQEVHDHVHGETQEHAHKHKEHHEKKKDEGDHNFEKGEGSKLDEEHHGHEGEKGHKGYKAWHEHEKAEKGHHDKEHASKEYDEKDGEEKKHEENGGYHEDHHHGEKGEKTAEFGEKGEHKKGHSTHGEHSVHKKDEYEKNTEFFDEFHEGGDMEKHGEHHHEHESKKGGHEKKGHHDAAKHEEKYGKEEKHEKGGHHHEHKGHKVEEGHDHHHDHDEKHGKKEGHEHGKKWGFKKGDDGGSAGGGHKHAR